MRKKRQIYLVSLFLFLSFVIVFTTIFYKIAYPIKFKEEILTYSKEFSLEPRLVASLINEESSFNENAISSAGAIGLMQILPSTGVYISQMLDENFDEEKLFDAKTNIRYGCKYLSYLKTKFKDEKTLLCAYNAGETIVSTWLKNEKYSNDGKSLNTTPFKETNAYVDNIMEGKRHYIKRV